MTLALCVVSFLTGAIAAGLLVTRRLTVRYDLHSYDKWRVQATRVREAVETADHEHRLLVREQRKVTRLEAINADLSHRAGKLMAGRLRRRRNAWVSYGTEVAS